MKERPGCKGKTCRDERLAKMKKFSLIALSLFFFLTATACGSAPQKAAAPQPEPVKLPDAQIETIAKAMVSHMTLAEKIGQMMIVGVDGTSMDKNALVLLQQYHVGGIILFDPNMQSRTQVQQLLSQLQANADDKGLPLFLGVDQEGGLVTRMKQSMYTAPSAAQLAATGDSQQIYEAARKTALDIKSVGFNLDFAPVLDINQTKQRSYGKTAAEVIQNAAVAAQAYQDAGIIFSFKHFPGIGKAVLDTHVGASTVPVSKEIIMKEDFLPFKELIKRFPNDQFMVMIGHLKFKAFNDTPASVEPQIVTDLLRKDAGFTGIAITDDMGMGALMEGYTSAQAGVKAVQAGQDILLVCFGQKSKQQVHDAVLAAVQDGRIPQSRIDQAATRVVTCKLKNLVTYRELKQFADAYTK
jgi:beta-N-acetylhexosaminidase